MRRATGLLGVAGVLVLAGCGGGSGAAESILENRLENAAEEEGVDVDIDLDDGTFRVETEDGNFEMTTDEDGNVSIDSDQGSMDMTADGDGNVSIEGEGGDGEDFSMEMNADEDGDGDMVIETEDGMSTTSTNGDLPDGFPDVLLPDGLEVLMAQESAFGDGTSYTLIGSAPGDWEEYFDDLVADLEGDGYTQDQVATTPDGAFFSFSANGETIAGGIGVDTTSDGGISVTLTISPTP